MTLSLTLACLWFVLAAIIAALPNRIHWPAAYALIALGIPLVGWVTLQNGPVFGLAILAGGTSVLHWPVIFAFRWLKRIATP